MSTTNCRKFKGEIETYLAKEKNIFESRIDWAFRMLHIKSKMNQTKIRKTGRGTGKLCLFLAFLTYSSPPR